MSECVCVCQADSRSALIKVHFDQLSLLDFWCCLCSRILRQPQGSTSNLRKHLQARHPKEFDCILQIMAEDPVVKVEDADSMYSFGVYTSVDVTLTVTGIDHFSCGLTTVSFADCHAYWKIGLEQVQEENVGEPHHLFQVHTENSC